MTYGDVEKTLERGVTQIFDPEGTFKNKLEAKISGSYKKDIIIKLGIDPTRPDIHLGHAAILRTLRKMQDFGCKVVFLIGDFTATIGDPTGKSKVRPELEQKEIEVNMKTYLDQVGKILKIDPEHFSWIRNSDWFHEVSDIAAPDSKVSLQVQKAGLKFDADINPQSFVGKAIIYENSRMQKTHLNQSEIQAITLRGLVWTLRHVTYSHLISRDMFQERIQKGEELYMHEMLYPVFQGIDSVVIAQIYGSCDMEIGGTDQTFNMLMGRDVMKVNNLPSQAVMSMTLLRGLDGKDKMSKSLDNYVAITDGADDMFGKIMSLPDDLMREYFELCTYTPTEEIKSIFEGEINPRNLKARLAKEIVSIYHGEKKANEALNSFDKVFSKGEFPQDPKVIESEPDSKLSQVIIESGAAPSVSASRILIESGAVSNSSGKKITDPNTKVSDLGEDRKLRIGKKTFIQVKLK